MQQSMVVTHSWRDCQPEAAVVAAAVHGKHYAVYIDNYTKDSVYDAVITAVAIGRVELVDLMYAYPVPSGLRSSSQANQLGL